MRSVSTHSRPKAAGIQTVQRPLRHVRFNTQPPEGGWLELHNRDIVIPHVSTHSRPKAAGWFYKSCLWLRSGFNTQPPEGGWKAREALDKWVEVSTHSRPKAAGRQAIRRCILIVVSTYSRPKAAGIFNSYMRDDDWVSTHSRPKAAGAGCWRIQSRTLFQHTAARRRLAVSAVAATVSAVVSTHSRPKAAGLPLRRRIAQIRVSTHSRPKAAGTKQTALSWAWMFQHTAARRRLEPHGFFGRAMIDVSTHSRPKAAGDVLFLLGPTLDVSTHSRPKAAGRTRRGRTRRTTCFNTQPPEGGWPNSFQIANAVIDVSTHSRPKAAGV